MLSSSRARSPKVVTPGRVSNIISWKVPCSFGWGNQGVLGKGSISMFWGHIKWANQLLSRRGCGCASFHLGPITGGRRQHLKVGGDNSCSQREEEEMAAPFLTYCSFSFGLLQLSLLTLVVYPSQALSLLAHTPYMRGNLPNSFQDRRSCVLPQMFYPAVGGFSGFTHGAIISISA